MPEIAQRGGRKAPRLPGPRPAIPGRAGLRLWRHRWPSRSRELPRNVGPASRSVAPSTRIRSLFRQRAPNVRFVPGMRSLRPGRRLAHPLPRTPRVCPPRATPPPRGNARSDQVLRRRCRASKSPLPSRCRRSESVRDRAACAGSCPLPLAGHDASQDFAGTATEGEVWSLQECIVEQSVKQAVLGSRHEGSSTTG
jgi:hypothetical protein